MRLLIVGSLQGQIGLATMINDHLEHGIAGIYNDPRSLGALAAEMALGHLAVETLAPGRKDTAAGDLAHRHESNVVPVPRIARPGIAEADQQEHR